MFCLRYITTFVVGVRGGQMRTAEVLRSVQNGGLWNCAAGDYQPRVWRSSDSSRAAAARPFIVPVTCSLASATILGSL